MQELIDALLIVDKANDLKNKSVYHNKFYLTNGSPEAPDIRVQKVIELANKHLINIEGGCNWENIDTLENLGYSIYAGEQDSFGWLIGIFNCYNFFVLNLISGEHHECNRYKSFFLSRKSNKSNKRSSKTAKRKW